MNKSATPKTETIETKAQPVAPTVTAAPLPKFNFNQPVECMDEPTTQEYYKIRREALLIGDDGILPNGKTVREEREANAKLYDEQRAKRAAKAAQTDNQGEKITDGSDSTSTSSN